MGAQRAVRPWIVVSGHRPIYSSSDGYSENGVPLNSPIPFVPINSATLQKVFEDLFIENKVDLVFQAHVHSYERCYPTKKNHRTSTSYNKPDAPVYVTIGNAGSIEGLADSGDLPGFGWTDPKPDWSAFRYGSGYGYGTLSFEKGNSMRWKFHHAK